MILQGETVTEINLAYFFAGDDFFGGPFHQYRTAVKNIGTVGDVQRFANVVVRNQYA